MTPSTTTDDRSPAGTQPGSGAYVVINELLQLRFAARDLKLSPRSKAIANLAGGRQSNFRGRGIEFDEVRRYQPGDDLRTLDWRVTARTGFAHTKLYHEERERPLILVADQRQSMFFGSQRSFKSVQAVHAAALLAWSGIAGGDRVGGLVLSNSAHHEVRPRRSHRNVLRFLELCEQYNHRLSASPPPEDSLDFSTALRDLRRIARPGSALFLISDFSDWSQRAYEQLGLLERHCEIYALAISDPLERELPPAGIYRVSDGRTEQTIDTAPRKLRKSYQQVFEQRFDSLANDLAQLGIPLLELSTINSPRLELARYFNARRKR